jgi:hypothetical protein
MEKKMPRTFKDIVSIDGFSIEDIGLSDIEEIESMLPKNGVVDLNIAERGLIYTLEGQNLCQEKIAKIDRWVAVLDSRKNKAWSAAALSKSKTAGHKTVKDKEWYAQADDDYIDACNALALGRACKKWFENKAGYFSSWHYTFKTFLRRDYSIENATSLNVASYNSPASANSRYPAETSSHQDTTDDWGETEWE